MDSIMTLQDRVVSLKALANENRLQIIEWILDPRAHFEEQVDGDLVDDGVCIGRIVDKIGLTQPTVTSHMKQLANAGLVSSKKIKNWVFYKPNRERLSAIMSYIKAD
jgi:ArsR family transcriptional regulator